MKKIFSTLGLILVSLISFAQHEVGSLLLVPKAGLNISSLSETDHSDYRTGIAAGAEMEYQANSQIAISVGALYSQQGATETINEYDCTYKFDYINFPVLVNFYVAKGLALKVGLEGGILVNEKLKMVGNGFSAEISLEKTLRNGDSRYTNKSFVAALPIGASYEYKNFQLDARYIIGLTDANECIGENDKHNLFQLTLGYKFKLK